MTAISLRAFQGLNKNISPKLLEQVQAQDAYNCDLGSGTLEPYNDLVIDDNNRGNPPSSIKSLYLFNDYYWFEFEYDVDVVPGPVADDEVASERTYYTHPSDTDFEPRVTSKSLATETGSQWPSSYRSLGIAYPAQAPVLTSEEEADCSEENKETVSYVYTFVSEWEEEGPPSNPAEIEVCTYEIVEYSIEDINPDKQEFEVNDDVSDVFTTGSNFTGITGGGMETEFTVASVDCDGSKTNIYVTGSIDYEESYTEEDTIQTLEIEKSCEDRPTVNVSISWTKSDDYSYIENPISKIYIYRTTTDSSGSTVYKYVGETASDSFVDNIETEELGEELLSTYWYPPPDNMSGLIGLPNGIMAGFNGKEICISEAYMPHAWPESYRHTVYWDIVGLGSLGSNLVVLTEGNPYIISGSSPNRMAMKRLNVNQACVSKRGIVSIGQSGLVYPSPDGLVLLTPSGQGIVLTERILNKQNWTKLINPSSIHAYQYDSKYIAFYDGDDGQGGFIIDPKDPSNSFMLINFYCDSGYSDLLTDTLYLVPTGTTDIKRWDSAEATLIANWKSKTFTFPSYTNLGVAQVIAKSYGNITLKIYTDGELRTTQVVESVNPFRLPSGFLAREWEIEIDFQDIIEEIRLANSPAELRGAQ